MAVQYGTTISAGQMEKIRIFERSCLRACLGRYRSLETDLRHYISNEKLYNLAKIKRIDNFIIKITRDHFANATTVKENSLICHPLFTNPVYIQKTLESGYIPPEAFIYLDKHGYIQNEQNVPILYHINRVTGRNKIEYVPSEIHLSLMRFNTSIPLRDALDKHRKDIKKYWWLE